MTTDKKSSMYLFAGAISLAIITGIIAANAGEGPAVLTLALLFVMTASIGNYKAGIMIAIVLLPLSATQVIPREIFGVKGFNPLNGALALSILSLMMAKTVKRGAILLPRWPRHFWWYTGTIVLASLYGSLHTSAIPPYFTLLKVIDFNTATGYLRDILFKPAIMLLTAFMLSVVVANTRQVRSFLVPLFISMLTLPLIVIGYVVISGVSLTTLAASEQRGFLSVLGIHANELGYMFNMAFALSLFCFFSITNRLAKWTLGLVTLILLIAIMLTFSRGAFLGAIAVGSYLLFTQRKFRTALVIMLFVALGTLVMPEAVIDRASTGVQTSDGKDLSAGRVDNIWKPLIPEVVASPLIGHGMSSILWSDAAIHRQILPVGHPHSAYLDALLDFGILGSIVAFLFFRHVWLLFSRISKFHPDPVWRGFFKGGNGCIIVMLVQGITDGSFTPTLTQTFLWLSYGIAIGIVARATIAARNQAKLRQALDNIASESPQ